ncbi:MAG: response regulator [Myxococcaceae bacterium]
MAGERILAVDDEEAVTMLLGRVLTRSGFTVATAGTGEEALTRLESESFDLLMVDKSLPRMSGFEVISRARALHPTLAVVMITAYPEPFTAAQERLDGYIAKPFRSLKLVEEMVKNALENRANALARADLKARLEKVVAELSPAGRKSP